MKPLCPLRFDGRDDCSCGENHVKMRAYGHQLKAAVARKTATGLSKSEVMSKLLKAGVPAGLCASLDRERWLETQALQAAKRFALLKSSASLYLAGPPGVGKSFAAGWVLFEYARTFPWDTLPSGYGVREPIAYCDAAEVATSTLTTDALEAKLEQLANARLVVVDDLPEAGTPTGRQRLANLLCSRLDAQRATVVTANLAPGVMGKEYGSRLEDRMRQAIRPPLESKSIRSGKEWGKVTPIRPGRPL